MVRLSAFAVFALGCASVPPPQTVIIDRPVYVFVPERSGPPVPPGPGIAESPLLVAAEAHRVERQAAAPVVVEVSAPPVVYERDYFPNYSFGSYYQPRESVVVVHGDHHKRGHHAEHHVGHRGEQPKHHVEHHQAHGDGHRSKPKQSKRQIERAVDRCDRRATEWARDRCVRGVAKR